MSVVIETTLGDITVDLFLDQRPITCLNFLKLCKMKYYNFNLFHSIRSGFIAQTGDPSGEGSGGDSIWGLLDGPDKRFFSGEKMPKIRHTDAGLLSMVCTSEMMVGSQFFFTLGPDLDSLDGVHCVIGEVAEGHEVLRKLNDVICDETHRPYQDVRITHTVVLEDPFSDPPGLRAPSRSPSPSAERLKGGRIAPDEELDETQGKSVAEIQEMIEEKEAKARATILEIVGDLPDADIAPPENVLFVCKLNPVTTDEDLEIIFSRFGKIVSCEVIRDKKSGDSLQYAFIEFSDKKSCEDAYFKMDNVLIDDRRIHVDFSQSVSKMRWLGKGRGVQHFNDADEKEASMKKDRSNRSRSKDLKQNHSRVKQFENKRNDDKYHNRQSNNDEQHKNERRSTKNTSHRERSRSKSKSESYHKNYKSGHSYRTNKSKDRDISQKSDVHTIRKKSSKTESSNQKTEKSNRTEEDRSRSRYGDKNYNKSDLLQDSKSNHSDRSQSESKHRQADMLRKKDTNKQRNRDDVIRNSKREERSQCKDQPSRSHNKRSKSINEEQSQSEEEPLRKKYDNQSNERVDRDYGNDSSIKIISEDKIPSRLRDQAVHKDKYEEDPKDRKKTVQEDRVDNMRKTYDKKSSGNKTDKVVSKYVERRDTNYDDKDIQSNKLKQRTYIRTQHVGENRHQSKNESKYQGDNEHDNVHKDKKNERHENNSVNRIKDKKLPSHKRQERTESHSHCDGNQLEEKRSKDSKAREMERCEFDHGEARTPTPREMKRKEELKRKKIQKDKKLMSSKKKSGKRKRKPSSSDSDSDTSDTSDSSSSSDTSSSSSDLDHKKKLKRKKKYLSSSSSSDSSSSSSSDTTSSDTSSSSSDSDVKKRKIKKNRKRTETKSKKK